MSSDSGNDAIHTLDGAEDPSTRLRAIAASLSPGSTIVVDVGNVASLDARLALLHGEWDDGAARRFTRRSVFALVRECGMVVTAFERIDARRTPSADEAPLGTIVEEIVRLDPNARADRFRLTLAVPDDASRALAEELERGLAAEEADAAAQIRTLVAAQQREQAELLQSRQELIAVQNGKLMRWSQFPRRVYRRLRRLVGR